MPSKSFGSGKKASASGSPKPARRPKKQRSASPSPESSRLLVLGIDASLTGFGLVVWDGQRQRVLRKRRFVTEGLGSVSPTAPRGLLASGKFRGTDEERIEFLVSQVARAVRKYGIYLCVIESPAFNAKGRGKTILSELNGVLKNRLMKQGVAFVMKPPTSLKLSFAGSGKASKADMQAAAKRLTRLDLSEDEADALAAACFGYDKRDELWELP